MIKRDELDFLFIDDGDKFHRFNIKLALKNYITYNCSTSMAKVMVISDTPLEKLVMKSKDQKRLSIEVAKWFEKEKEKEK